jgi:serine phosphatase RsbU (regulator of sigma subunit)
MDAASRPAGILQSDGYTGLVTRIPAELDRVVLETASDAPSGDWVGAARAGTSLVRLLQADLEGKGDGARPYHDCLCSRLHQDPTAAPGDWIRDVDSIWPGERSATLAVVDLDLKHHRIRVALAGHPVPIVRGRSGKAAPLRSYGHFFPVGMKLTHEPVEVPWLRFTPGSILVLATDGVLEAGAGRRDLFGMARLKSAVEAASEPHDIFDSVLREVHHHLDGQLLEDDLTLLVIGRTRAAAPALADHVRSTRDAYGQ